MPNRIIRDALLDSPRYHALSSDAARLLYVEILLLADDYGLSPAYPLFLSRRTSVARRASDEAIAQLLQELSDKDLIRLYMHSGQQYLYIPRFGNWPRAKFTKWPLPPDALGGNEIKDLQQKRTASALRPQCNRSANVPETETETETETEREVSAAAPSAQTAPSAFLGDENLQSIRTDAKVCIAPSWELPTEWGRDAEKLGWRPAEILKQAEKFRQYWVAGKGAGSSRTLKGWRQSWSNWLSRAERYA